MTFTAREIMKKCLFVTLFFHYFFDSKTKKKASLVCWASRSLHVAGAAAAGGGGGGELSYSPIVQMSDYWEHDAGPRGGPRREHIRAQGDRGLARAQSDLANHAHVPDGLDAQFQSCLARCDRVLPTDDRLSGGPPAGGAAGAAAPPFRCCSAFALLQLRGPAL